MSLYSLFKDLESTKSLIKNIGIFLSLFYWHIDPPTCCYNTDTQKQHPKAHKYSKQYNNINHNDYFIIYLSVPMFCTTCRLFKCLHLYSLHLFYNLWFKFVSLSQYMTKTKTSHLPTHMHKWLFFTTKLQHAVWTSLSLQFT